MNMLREWAAAVCICAVGCSLVGMLLPQSQINKIFKLLTAVMILSCLVSPLTKLWGQAPNFSAMEESTQMQKVSEQAEKSVQQLAFDSSQAKIEQIVRYNLERIGVYPQKTEILIHNDESDNILYIEAVLLLDREYLGRQEEIRDFIRRELDLSCTFQWNEEEEKNE